MSCQDAARRRLAFAQDAQPEAQTNGKPQSRILRIPQQTPIQRPLWRRERLALWLTSLVYAHGYDNIGKRLWFPRTRKFLAWLAQLVWQMPTYLWVKRGGLVCHDVYYARLRVCETCVMLSRRAAFNLSDIRDGTYCILWYCRSCRCGEKPRAELHKKLWFARHECPEGKHMDGWGQILKAEIDDDTVDDDVDDDRASNMDADIFRKRSDILKSATNIGNGD